MLVRFSSVKTESITMFGDVAVQLIRLLGGSGAVPGAIAAEDIPAGIKRLRAGLASQKTVLAPPDRDSDDDEKEDKEPAIDLSTRAGPLLDILERASAADAPVMWEKM